MQDKTFKHLKIEDIREFVRAAEDGGESTPVAGNLSSEAQKELMSLCAHGAAQDQVDFMSRLDHFVNGSATHDFDTCHARLGMEKLGLAHLLDDPPKAS